MLKIPVVMMLHTFDYTMERRLGSFNLVWRQGSFCPLYTSTRMQRPQKGSNFYVLQLIIKEVFRARQMQPCKSPFAGSSNWMRGGVTSIRTNAECIGRLEEWSKESSTRTPRPPTPTPSTSLPWLVLECKQKIVRLKLKLQVSTLLEIVCSQDQGKSGRLIVVGKVDHVPLRGRTSLGRLNFTV